MSVEAVAVVMPVVPLLLTGLESCRVSVSVPSTSASSWAVRSKPNVVPTKVSSKVSVLVERVTPAGRAASMATARVWVVSELVSAPPKGSVISTLTELPELTAADRVMVKVAVSPASSEMLAGLLLRAKVRS